MRGHKLRIMESRGEKKKKTPRAIYLKWGEEVEEEEGEEGGGLSKVFETDEGGGGRGGGGGGGGREGGGGGGGREGKLGGHIKTARGLRCWIILEKVRPLCAPSCLTSSTRGRIGGRKKTRRTPGPSRLIWSNPKVSL